MSFRPVSSGGGTYQSPLCDLLTNSLHSSLPIFLTEDPNNVDQVSEGAGSIIKSPSWLYDPGLTFRVFQHEPFVPRGHLPHVLPVPQYLTIPGGAVPASVSTDASLMDMQNDPCCCDTHTLLLTCPLILASTDLGCASISPKSDALQDVIRSHQNSGDDYILTDLGVVKQGSSYSPMSKCDSHLADLPRPLFDLMRSAGSRFVPNTKASPQLLLALGDSLFSMTEFSHSENDFIIALCPLHPSIYSGAVPNHNHFGWQYYTIQQAGRLQSFQYDADSPGCDFYRDCLTYDRYTMRIDSDYSASLTDEDFRLHNDRMHSVECLEQSIGSIFDWAHTGMLFAGSRAWSTSISSYFEESCHQFCKKRSILVDATQYNFHEDLHVLSSAHMWPYSSSSIRPDNLELYIEHQAGWNESVATAGDAANPVQALSRLTISSGAVPRNNRGSMDFFQSCIRVSSSPSSQQTIDTDVVSILGKDASHTVHDLFRMFIPLHSALSEPHDSIQVQFTGESYFQPDAQVNASDVYLDGQLFREECHRPQQSAIPSGAVPSDNHRISNRNHFSIQDYSALSEPHDSIQAQFTGELYFQLDAQVNANDFYLASQLFREECHRPQQFTISSGAVPSDNHRISNRNHFSIRDFDFLQPWSQHSDDLNLHQARPQCPGTVQPLHHQRSSIGTREAIYNTFLPSPGFADLTDRQICTLMCDGSHQAHDHTPSRGVYASPYVPRHQNNDVVLPVPLQGFLCQECTNASNSLALQAMVDFPTLIHKCDTVIDETDLQQLNDRSLLFDVRQAAQRQLHNTTFSRAALDPILAIQGFLRAPTQSPLQVTSSSGAVPVNDLSHAASFRGWGRAIYGGGHPAWGRCEIIHLAPNPPFAERCAAATQDNGWLASDEALWFMRLLKTWRSDIAIGPLIQWSPSRDLQHLMAAEDQLQCNNGYLNILLFLVDWCAVEVDRRTEPVHVVLIQWPQEHHTLVTLEISRILQIPTNRMLVTIDTTHEVVTMCGWTILFRWYTNFAMQTCLQPLIHATDQNQAQIDSVLNRAQRHWNRTNAPSCLRNFAAECRRAFMSAYARDQPDTRLPDVVSTVMFVGPQEEYVQEVIQVPRPPTHREREINWLRNTLIQPAWLTNFEVELVLQMTRMQILDRFLPGPLHFDPVTGQLEPFVNDLPSVAGYTKVLFFVTLNYHWISISGTQHQNRWMLTAVVPDPRSRDMPPLFDAIATLLETSPDRVHIQAIPMHSPPHLCGWLLLYSLQEHGQVSILHDATMLLQRIAVMPNSRIKTLIFEEALSTWTRHAPHQSLVTFATQVRTYFLAHMDTWSAHHVLHFGGMFPQSTPVPKSASWTAISQATKAKILMKIRSHVQRPYICPCVDRLTAFVEVDRLVEANDTVASFIAYIKPSPLQWASQFCQENVLPEPCSHVRITEVVLQVPSRSADLIPPHVEAIIYRGRVQFLRSQVVVQVHDLESGIRIFRTGRNHPTTNFDVGELCSGAFSGWTQATKVLSTMGYPIQTKFAIDHDHCVATWYARNYTDSAIAARPEDVFRLRDECFYYREAPITLQTDVSLGWYLLFCEPVDIITASPPCPAFSNASNAAGLEKPEGQVIIDTILKILLLQPKIMVLEEVASLRSHVHFPLILELLNWGNFQVAWQEVLNLDDWLPQSRPRLILIAFRRCSYGLKHFACKPWNPSPSRSLSLQESHCLLADEAIIEITSAPLDIETAKLYFDHAKIPGATPRSFKDVLRFRLRTPNDRVQCIMASYAFGHEIDADSQSQKGIFGSILRHQGRLRFLAGPELLWLQGLSVEWQGPLNPRLLNHIIGNAISVPHALIGFFQRAGSLYPSGI